MPGLPIAAPGTPQCPSRSPLNGYHCVLQDDPDAHPERAHVGLTPDGEERRWRIGDDEWSRWGLRSPMWRPGRR